VHSVIPKIVDSCGIPHVFFIEVNIGWLFRSELKVTLVFDFSLFLLVIFCF